MQAPPRTVVETPEFVGRVRRLFTEQERDEVVDYLAGHPDAGDVIPGSGGARKLRWAAKGKGKSGGARVITFYSGTSVPVFLLSVFGKGEKVDLSAAERNDLRAVLADLLKEYRKGVHEHVQSRR